ncbi:PilZ domain-containing protein [Thermodesulfobacteriota bacterium]
MADVQESSEGATVEKERRQSSRHEQGFEVQFASENEFVSSFTFDCGTGGLFLKTHQELSPGDQLQIQFNLPDQQQSISATAEVRWARKNGLDSDGFGLKFVSMSRGDFLKLSTYLEKLGLVARTGG